MLLLFRYLKCLGVGMTPESVLTDEDREAKYKNRPKGTRSKNRTKRRTMMDSRVRMNEPDESEEADDDGEQPASNARSEPFARSMFSWGTLNFLIISNSLFLQGGPSA